MYEINCVVSLSNHNAATGMLFPKYTPKKTSDFHKDVIVIEAMLLACICYSTEYPIV